MATFGKYAVLDLETRCNLDLARAVLHLDASVDPAEVARRLAERRRAETGSQFPKLPFHEPVAAAILLVHRAGRPPNAPLVAADWRCWRTGELPIEAFVQRFFQIVAGRTYVGFNSHAFDLPLMELWASRCRVSAPAHFHWPARVESPRFRYAADFHLDLQKDLANWASGAGNFDELCKFHGLPGKPGVHGDDVERLLTEGRLDEVHAYNVTDVLQTFLLFLHAEIRAGRLTRDAAARSALGALRLTRHRLLARLRQGSAAFELLEGTLDQCARAPIADCRDAELDAAAAAWPEPPLAAPARCADAPAEPLASAGRDGESDRLARCEPALAE